LCGADFFRPGGGGHEESNGAGGARGLALRKQARSGGGGGRCRGWPLHAFAQAFCGREGAGKRRGAAVRSRTVAGPTLRPTPRIPPHLRGFQGLAQAFRHGGVGPCREEEQETSVWIVGNGRSFVAKVSGRSGEKLVPDNRPAGVSANAGATSVRRSLCGCYQAPAMKATKIISHVTATTL